MTDKLPTGFAGGRGALMRLALRTSLLTLGTLGLYRFWGRTRLRQWYWSAIRPGGDPLEYTGAGAEKFAGFLLAVCGLAVWLGVVNLLLMFVSLSVLAAPWLAYVLSFAGLIPVWFFARYRARAYMLGRTRWRGIRFGMAPGAWGYAGRACWHGLVTLVTLGALWPRMTFALEKYRTDRTWFGTVRLHQGGDWTMLLPAFAPVLLGGVVAGLALALGITSTPRMAWLAVPFGAVALVGAVRFRVLAVRLMADAKTAGGMGLIARPDPWVVLRTLGCGWLAIGAFLGLVALVTGLGLSLLSDAQVEALLATGPETAQDFALLGGIGAVYFGLFVGFGVLRHGLITLPVLRHYAQSLTLTGAHGLGQVTQRGGMAAGEAGGLAEALDIGAAI